MVIFFCCEITGNNVFIYFICLLCITEVAFKNKIQKKSKSWLRKRIIRKVDLAAMVKYHICLCAS